jgi:galactokinase
MKKCNIKKSAEAGFLQAQLKNKIEQGCFDHNFNFLYGEEALEDQKIRYSQVVDAHGKAFGQNREVYLFSSPGRVEIVGNHTDHNDGHVLCGAINLDIIGAVSKNQENKVKIHSKEFGPITVDLGNLNVNEEERYTSAALVRGVAEGCKVGGWAYGGFNAYFSSDLMVGSGLSSSAAFGIMVVTIFNHLYNSIPIPAEEAARIGMMAETLFFGKPSGLMDQMAVAAGGITAIDLESIWRPKLQFLNFDFSSMGLEVVVVDTGESHEDLVSDYASIPLDMSHVAEFFGKASMREVQKEQIVENLPNLRKELGDRAVLRALHYLDENERVLLAIDAIKKEDRDGLLTIIKESGCSSFQYLQNVCKADSPQNQNLTIALYFAQHVLGQRGAWRVHGGGFAGTTLNLVPSELLDSFIYVQEKAFYKGCCHILKIRKVGGSILLEENLNV